MRDFKVLIRTFTLLGLDTALPSTTAVEEEVTEEVELYTILLPLKVNKKNRQTNVA